MKKDCMDEQTLWEYLDEELDGQQLPKIEAHLKNCPCCQKALKEVQCLDNQFSHLVKFCHQKNQATDTKVSTQEMPQPMYHQYKGMVWMILSLLTIFSIFSALLFIAIIAPDVSTLPFSGEFIFLKSFAYKTLQFFLNSSLIIGLVFLGLFAWNLMFSSS